VIEARVPVVVVGSGIAGLSFSLKVSEFTDVLLLTKKNRAASNTNWARGGIAAVVGPDDDRRLHVQDTLVAGAGLCHMDVVKEVVAEGPERIRDLMEWGTRFHRENGALSLGKEGGHSRRRIVHAGDRTGRTIESALLAAVAARPGIAVVEDLMVVDLLTEGGGSDRRCTGIRGVQRHTGEEVHVRAEAVLLATGGSGQVYQHTTNPGIATGDGVAMAYRAGALVANMEFIQFHPTALFPTEDPAFLISEAVRGEGARLRTVQGRPFMEDLHPLGSLAPRDVVARGIHRVLRETGDDHVVLDVSGISRDLFAQRFPSTLDGCLSRGVDPFAQGIPVVPAAHYQCGGVWTDRRGATSLPGLFATGEVACTGLHGANRLASNSLLEAVVYSHRAAEYLRTAGVGRLESDDGGLGGTTGVAPEEWDESPEPSDPERAGLRSLLWDHAGIIRRRGELQTALGQLETLAAEVDATPPAGGPEFADALERRNLHQVGWLILRSALDRPESRGLHHVEEHPFRNNEACLRDTALVRP
jgi:L-aspartate oxidase